MAAPRKTTVPAGARKPQDHQTAAEETVDEGFSFEVDGTMYTLLPATGRLGRGFYRRVRKESQVDQMFSIVEELAPDEETLDAFDSIPDEDFKDAFGVPFNEYLKSIKGASTGESSAS